MMFPKPTTLKSSAIRDSARGQECQLRMPWCNHNPETVVLCHIRLYGGAGVGSKPVDLHAYYGCSECHRREAEADEGDLLRAMMHTQLILLQDGLISEG